MPPGRLLPLAALFILLALATAAQAYQQRLSQPVLLPSARGLSPVLLTSRGPVPLPWMPAPSGTVTHVVYTNITWHGRPLSQLPPREAARILREAAKHGWRLPGLRVEEEKLTLLSYRPGEESIVVLLPVRLDARPLAQREALEEAARLGAKQVYTLGGAAIALVASPRAPMLPPLGPRDHVAIAVTGPWGTAVFRATGSQLLHPAQAQKLQPLPSILSTKPASMWSQHQAPSQAWPGPASQQESMLIDVVPWSDVHYQEGEAPGPLVEHIQLGAWRRWLLSHRAYTPPRTTRMTLTFIATSSKSNIFTLRMSLNSDTLLDPVATIEPGARYIAQLVYYTTPQPSMGPENTIRVEVDAPSQPVDMKARILLTAVSIAGSPTPGNAVAEAESTAYGIVGVENGRPVLSTPWSQEEQSNPPIAMPLTGTLTVPLPASPSVLDSGASVSALVHCTYPVSRALITAGSLAADCTPVDSSTFLCSINGPMLANQLWSGIELGQPLPVTITVSPKPKHLYDCVAENLHVGYETRARAAFVSIQMYRSFSSFPINARAYKATFYVLRYIEATGPATPRTSSTIGYAAATLSVYGWRPTPDTIGGLDITIYAPATGSMSKPLYLGDNDPCFSSTSLDEVSGTIVLAPQAGTDKPLEASRVTVYALGSGGSVAGLGALFSAISYMLGGASLILSGGSATIIGLLGQLIATPTLFYHGSVVQYKVYSLPNGDAAIKFTAYPGWPSSFKGVAINIAELNTPTDDWHGGLNIYYSMEYRLHTDVTKPEISIHTRWTLSGSLTIPLRRS